MGVFVAKLQRLVFRVTVRHVHRGGGAIGATSGHNKEGLLPLLPLSSSSSTSGKVGKENKNQGGSSCNRHAAALEVAARGYRRRRRMGRRGQGQDGGQRDEHWEINDNATISSSSKSSMPPTMITAKR